MFPGPMINFHHHQKAHSVAKVQDKRAGSNLQACSCGRGRRRAVAQVPPRAGSAHCHPRVGARHALHMRTTHTNTYQTRAQGQKRASI